MGELDVTSSNWSSGTGVIDSYNSLITDIKNAHDEDKGVAAAEIGVAVFGAVVDTVSTLLNPLGKLIAAGLGWLIEHVEFLKKPLDWLTGDPDAIKALADQLHAIGQDLRNTATDMGDNLNKTVTQWNGTAADSFRSTLGDRQSDIDGAGHSVDIAGYVVETTMALISAVRNLIRDMVTSTLGDIIATMLIALATAPFTFGASIAVGVTKCVVEGVAKVAEMVAKIAKLVGFSTRTVKRIDDLVAVLRKTATGDAAGTHTAGAANDVHAPADAPAPNHDAPADDAASTHTAATDDSDAGSWHTANDEPDADDAASTHTNDSDDSDAASWHTAQDEPNADDAASTHTDDPNDEPAANDDEPPDEPATNHDEPADEPAANHDEPAAAPAPPKTGESLLKPLDHPNLKLHEDWLKNNGFADQLTNLKFNENWLKQNHPDLFTGLKTISDLKSSKNMLGLTDKYVTQVVKQLSDIQERAQMSWDDANSQWQQQHPGEPTAST
jgi:hypothetical protein